MTESLFASSRLCYVEGSWAYFTTQPIEDQWGDDWDDAPYEHNAGSPYDWRPTVHRRQDDGEWKTLPNPKPAYEIARVAWCGGGDLETPADLNPPNSAYSVQQINRREIAWLTDPGYGTRPRVFTPVVWAGITLSEFVQIIEELRGGTVFVPISWGES